MHLHARNEQQTTMLHSTVLPQSTSRIVDCSLVMCIQTYISSSLQCVWNIACADTEELADTLHGSVRLLLSSGQQAPRLLAECDTSLQRMMPEYLPARHWSLHMKPESGHCMSQTKTYMRDSRQEKQGRLVKSACWPCSAMYMFQQILHSQNTPSLHSSSFVWRCAQLCSPCLNMRPQA